MKELILKVERWAQDRNLINGCKPIDQAMKLFSEAGELADNIGKGRDIKDDVGDCAVVAIIVSKQLSKSIVDELSFDRLNWAEDTNKQLVLKLMQTICEFNESASLGYWHYGIARRLFNILGAIARNHKTTLEECLSVAYNDISERRGILWNGIFVKTTDDNYDDIKSMFDKSIEDNFN